MFFGDTTTLFAIHHGKSSCQLTKPIKLDQYGYELMKYIHQTFREQGTFDIFKMRGSSKLFPFMDVSLTECELRWDNT